jgi:4-hydroxy-tetrahydrodipicolinate synthase
MMACGASGVISVTSNVRPREVSEVTKLAATGEMSKARDLHLKLLDLHGLMFAEPNPAPAKAGLAAEGKMNASVRLPLLPAREATRSAVVEALKKLGNASAGSASRSVDAK